MARVLIVGCGYVGNVLAARLRDAGHEVFGLRRNVAGLAEGIEPICADLANPASLTVVPGGLEVAFFLAAPSTHNDSSYEAIYLDGLDHLMDVLEPQADTLRRLFYASSTGVYAQDDGGWVDESSPTEPHKFNGLRVLQGERLAASTDIPTTAVRFGGIYGPERTRLVEFVKNGLARLHPGPTSYTNRIHRDDCAGVLHHLMDLPAPESVYVAVDDDPTPYNELITYLAARFHVPPPPQADAPRPAGKRCSNAALRASGYELIYPGYRHGYDAILAP